MHKYIYIYIKEKAGFKIVSPTALCELTYKINRETIPEGKHASRGKGQNPTEGSLHSDTFQISFKKRCDFFCILFINVT